MRGSARLGLEKRVPSAASAFGVFFLRQFFLGLPRELEEAALLEGANSWQIFTKVILPLSKPALATLAVIAFSRMAKTPVFAIGVVLPLLCAVCVTGVEMANYVTAGMRVSRSTAKLASLTPREVWSGKRASMASGK